MKTKTSIQEIYHIHHVKPKHMGGSDHPSNLEKLTVHEHANRHYELWYLCGSEKDYFAWKCLSGQIKNSTIWLEQSRLGGLICAEKLKNIDRKALYGNKVSESLRGKPKSDIHKIHLSESLKGRKRNYEVKLTANGRQKLSDFGKTLIAEKNPFFGKKHTEETKKMISETKKAKNANKRAFHN